jgi:hypothetical protein
VADAMTDRQVPSHMRRALWAKRVQLILAVAAGGFAIYRLVEGVMHPSLH